MDLTCPKCHGAMRSYERNGVHVDQCGECRGIFLDRGELEHLMDAENRWNGPGQPATPQPTGQQPGSQSPPSQGSIGAMMGDVLQRAQQERGQQGGHGQRDQYGQQRHQSRKKSSFLGELFG